MCKKCGKFQGGCWVRQKPVQLVQLDMFDEDYERRVLYVSSKKNEQEEKQKVVF